MSNESTIPTTVTEHFGQVAADLKLADERLRMVCSWAHHARNRKSGLTPAKALRWIDELGERLFGEFPADAEKNTRG